MRSRTTIGEAAEHLEEHEMNARSQQRRIEGSKYAVQLISLIASSDLADPDYIGGLVDRIVRDTSQKPIEVADLKPEPIARLGATEMPFGEHKGTSFDDVPLEYLDWLCRTQENFYKSLRAYLKHPELESRRRGIGE